MEITANQLLGLNVYSLEQGEKIGQVHNFLLDTQKKELIALLIGNKKIIKDDAVLCLTDVAGLSFEAVTVDSPAVLRKKNDCPHLKQLLKCPPDITGLSILKKDGTFLGRAESFYIDSETGKITRIEISIGFLGNLVKDRKFLPIEQIEIIGSDMILATDNAKIEEKINHHSPSQLKQRTKQKIAAVKPEPGCKEKIMAISDKGLFQRRNKIIFPEIETEETMINEAETQKKDGNNMES